MGYQDDSEALVINTAEPSLMHGQCIRIIFKDDRKTEAVREARG